jgi:acetyl coenzyme A synthetase (ADP forming)-like protein
MSSLDPIFRPASIAVIGASRTPGAIGYGIVHNLIERGYQGALYPVNPRARFVHSIPAFPSIREVPGPVDLAVVVVPKDCVLEVVDDCAAKQVPALVVISAGFREVGGAGAALEAELVERTRGYGMRLVGPNCIGVTNTDPAVSMNATFAPTMPPPGPVSFMSQSGAMGVTILDYAATYGIGIHHFVSMGNRADVSSNDLVQYWADDPDTELILMYLESFGNPRNFTRIAREVTRRKPILAVKAGRTRAGARAALSHTGALAGLDVATDALLTQCGVIRAETLEELFDLAAAFTHLAPPQGDRVAIVTNAGGPGIILADTCEAAGLRVTDLSPETERRLAETLPAEASTRNPVDMIASASPEIYSRVLELVLADPHVDAVIASFVPLLGIPQLGVAEAIIRAHQAISDKPLLAVLMGREGLPAGRAELAAAGIPAYIFPESAARALAALVRHRRWLERPAGTIRHFTVDDDAVTAILDRATGPAAHPSTRPSDEPPEHGAGEFLPLADALAILRAYGIPVIEHRTARSPDEAAAAARELGFPVALKVLSPEIVHKTELGGVALDLRDETSVRTACSAILDRVALAAPHARVDGVMVERYLEGGRETIVGMTLDPSFGPLVMFGLGGIHVEVLRDVAFRVEPLSDIDTDEMIRSIRGFRLLEGYRGEPPADLAALADVIQRISQLVGTHHRIAELEINPLNVFEQGAIAVDARIRVAVTRIG